MSPVLTSDYIVLLLVLYRSILSNPTVDGSHRGTLPSYTFGSTGSRVRQRDRFKQDRVTHYGDDSPGPCQYDGHRVLVAFGKSMLSGKREVGAAKFGTSNKHTLGSFKKPAQNHDPHYPGPGKYMLMSSIGKQTESQRPTQESTTFGKQMKIDGPGSFFNEGSADMPGKNESKMLIYPRTFISTWSVGH